MGTVSKHKHFLRTFLALSDREKGAEISFIQRACSHWLVVAVYGSCPPGPGRTLSNEQCGPEEEVRVVECMLHFVISILEQSLNNTSHTLVFAWICVTASTLIFLLLSTRWSSTLVARVNFLKWKPDHFTPLSITVPWLLPWLWESNHAPGGNIQGLHSPSQAHPWPLTSKYPSLKDPSTWRPLRTKMKGFKAGWKVKPKTLCPDPQDQIKIRGAAQRPHCIVSKFNRVEEAGKLPMNP